MTHSDTQPAPSRQLGVAVWTSVVLVAMAGLLGSGVFTAPLPGSAGVALALAGALLALAARSARSGLVAIAAASAVCLSAPVLFALAAARPTFGFMTPLAHLVLQLLGVETETANGALFVQTGDQLVFRSEWAKCGLLPIAWILLSGAVVLAGLDAARPLRAFTRLVLVTLLYGLVRYALLVLLAIHHPDPAYSSGAFPFVILLFVHPVWQAVTFLPLVLFLSAARPFARGELRLRGGRRVWRAAACAAASGLALAAGQTAYFSGVESARRVLIDESHSQNWSSALGPLDTETYGRDTVYNYTMLVQLLGQRYDVEVHADAPYSDEVLEDVDVLILKTATSPFQGSERAAIERFVERGGGLFVIGDHTDLLGMTTHLNPVIEPFGMRFRSDACNQLDDGQSHAWTPLPWSAHPATRGIERIDFMTSCTLELEAPAEPVLLARNAFSDPLDYSAPSFFGNVAPDLDDDIGLLVVAGAREYGRGRVLVFGDSTIFSTFGLMIGGRSQFLERTVDWLGRSQRTGGLARPLGVPVARWTAGLGLFWLLAALALRPGLGPAAYALPPALLVGCVLGVAAGRAVTTTGHALPPPSRPLPTIAFLEDGCDFALPSPLHEDDVAPERAFDALFAWTQRVGLVPTLRSAREARSADVVALVRPEAAVLHQELAGLGEHVRGGGGLLLLLDDASALGAVVAQLAGDGAPVPPRSDGPGRAVELPLGAGTAVIVTEARDFSRVGMGDQLEDCPPSDPRRATFDELFRLLRLAARV